MCSEVLESFQCSGCGRKDGENHKTRLLKKLSIGKVSLIIFVSRFVSALSEKILQQVCICQNNVPSLQYKLEYGKYSI
jgi:hypothetical protein